MNTLEEVIGNLPLDVKARVYRSMRALMQHANNAGSTSLKIAVQSYETTILYFDEKIKECEQTKP